MLNVLITGTSKGIGRATAIKFLNAGYRVYGIDRLESTIDSGLYNNCYYHFVMDVADKKAIEELAKSDRVPEMNIVINNAGIQLSETGYDVIDVNLRGTINVTESFAFQPQIRSVVMIASVSGSTGSEFPEYVASKGGMIAYMRNVAIRLPKKGYRATCNSLSFGGVTTELNAPVLEDKKLWKEIMNVTPLKKWMSAEESAEWIYFISAVNTFCSGEDIIIDGGESKLNQNFVWP